MTAVPALHRTISDGVVALREWAIEDAPQMRRIFLDPEMYRWTDAVPDEPLTEFEEAIRRNWRRRERGDRIALAICDAEGAIVGAIDLMMGEFERGEIGYAVGAWARGNGYAARAVKLLSSWAFETAGVARLELPIPVGNARSRAVAERAGFRFEGILRGYLHLREGGERHDVTMFALLPGDAPAA